MQQAKIQTVEAPQQIRGKLVWSFKHPSPRWAILFFRTVFVTTTIIVAAIFFKHALTPTTKAWLLFWSKVIDFIIWFFTRALGVKRTSNF